MKNRKLLVLSMVLSSVLTMTGCGESGTSDSADGKVDRINFWSIGDQFSMTAYKNLVDYYNENQGKLDGVQVKISFKQDHALCNLWKQQITSRHSWC